jgi:hypothetical protein
MQHYATEDKTVRTIYIYTFIFWHLNPSEKLMPIYLANFWQPSRYATLYLSAYPKCNSLQ